MNAIRKMSFKLLENEEELMTVKIIAFREPWAKGHVFAAIEFKRIQIRISNLLSVMYIFSPKIRYQ